MDGAFRWWFQYGSKETTSGLLPVSLLSSSQYRSSIGGAADIVLLAFDHASEYESYRTFCIFNVMH